MGCINFRKENLTTANVIDLIESEPAATDVPDIIYIQPPADTGNDSDAESGDEDCMDYDINKFSKNQLESQVEVEYKDENDESDEEEVVNRKKKKKLRNWVKLSDNELPDLLAMSEDIAFAPPLTLGPTSEPIEFFDLFLSPDIIIDLVNFTNKYAALKNSNFVVDKSDIYSFIGILLLSGYCTCSRRRMYWENRPDTENTLVKNTMRRNTFDNIFRYFHACDNLYLDNTDRYAKVRPLITKINENFLKYAPIENCVSIDESMIKYFGKHPCKQFIKVKPIRFGYKTWSLALKTGYCLQFDVYQGKKLSDATQKSEYGLGGSVVLNFANLLQEHFTDINFSLFFDNYFTSPKLITKLVSQNIGATGTVRSNRTENCILASVKSILKNERGSMDSCIDKDSKLLGIRWKDNNIVTIFSNQYGIEPMKTIKRYSAKEKKHVFIPQPFMIQMYNTYMGGVDLMDNIISNYQISIRGKKWYTPIIFWMFDAAVSNAWVLSKAYGCKFDKLEFTRQIVERLCTTYGKKPKKSGPLSRRTSQIDRHTGLHLVETGQRRRNCAYCKNKTVTACQSCDVPLHDKCFISFHE